MLTEPKAHRSRSSRRRSRHNRRRERRAAPLRDRSHRTSPTPLPSLAAGFLDARVAWSNSGAPIWPAHTAAGPPVLDETGCRPAVTAVCTRVDAFVLVAGRGVHLGPAASPPLQPRRATQVEDQQPQLEAPASHRSWLSAGGAATSGVVGPGATVTTPAPSRAARSDVRHAAHALRVVAGSWDARTHRSPYLLVKSVEVV